MSSTLHEKQDTSPTPHRDVLDNVSSSLTAPSQKWELPSGEEILEGLLLLRRGSDGAVY